jgi:Ran-binding protein 1
MVRLDEETSDNDKSINLSRNDSVSEDGKLDSSHHDPYYPPIVNLPEVDVPTGEDGEDEIFKIRAKLFRFDSASSPPEWKERGTGDVRLLQHNGSKLIRLLMRREKTLRICANHFVRPWMILKPMKGSDRAYIWQVHADFADEETKTEVLAIRFANPENASKFKSAFDAAVISVTEVEATSIELAETQVTTEAYESETKKETATKDTVQNIPKDQQTIPPSNESSKDVTEELKQLTVTEK